MSSGMPASRQRSRSASQPSGRNNSPSSRQWKSPRANPKWTVTRQFSVLPRRPHHCFWTPGGLVPLLGVAGLVEEPDGVRALVLGGDESLEPIPHLVLPPLELAEELQQGARGDVRLQRDRLDALLTCLSDFYKSRRRLLSSMASATVLP